MGKTRVLVIEDERALAEVVTYNLEREGYEVATAHDGHDGLRKATLLPDLIILDLMLPGVGGIEICRSLRAGEHTRRIPILMLTAKAEEADQIVGFAVGADDYVTKPFSVKVVMQRVRALIRRREEETSHDVVTEHLGVRLDRERHRAFVKQKPVELTPTEFRLLDTLLRQPGRAFTRRDLMEAAVGSGVFVLERTIDVHIKSLRRKMGPAGDYVETVRSVGYRFKE
ncbi:MAG: response regulator [Gemmataceae bacterium]